MFSPEEIYENHWKAFKEGKIPVKDEHYLTHFIDIKELLETGKLSPSLWRMCAERVCSPYQFVELYSLLSFSSRALKEKHKRVFITVLNGLGITQVNEADVKHKH